MTNKQIFDRNYPQAKNNQTCCENPKTHSSHYSEEECEDEVGVLVLAQRLKSEDKKHLQAYNSYPASHASNGDEEEVEEEEEEEEFDDEDEESDDDYDDEDDDEDEDDEDDDDLDENEEEEEVEEESSNKAASKPKKH